MKNLLSDPRIILSIAGGFFLFALIDSLGHDASSFSELGIVGKVSVVLFLIPFTFLIVKYLILPIGNAIIKWFM